MNRSRFQAGSGVFTCTACGRLTRHTGVQSMDTRLCPDDYELAGIFNAYQDYGEAGAREYADAIRHHTANIAAKGGTLDSDALELLEAIKGEV